MSFFRNMIIISLCLAGCRQGEKPQPSVSSKPCAGYDKPDTLSIRHFVDMYVPQTGPKSAAYILEEGDAAMIARAWMTGHARKTIDIQYFIFSLDNVGLIACDYLLRISGALISGCTTKHL